jgi:hypothetical protein
MNSGTKGTARMWLDNESMVLQTHMNFLATGDSRIPLGNPPKKI